jgi:YidC/Oxa1 family membrane protein insertase
MNPVSLLIEEIIYRPIFNGLIWFLSIFQWNLWFAIITLTLVIRLILLKSTNAGTEMQKQMWDLQPKLQEIQTKYADNPKKLQEETMNVLKKHGAWPLKWCMMTLLQLPVFIWLFYVMKHINDKVIMTNNLYSFFQSFWLKYTDIAAINTNFFWLDLMSSGSVLLTILAWIFIYLQMKITTLSQPKAATVPWWPQVDMSKMSGFMNIFLVFMLGSFVYSAQSSIGLYIITTSVFSVAQLWRQYRALWLKK